MHVQRPFADHTAAGHRLTISGPNGRVKNDIPEASYMLGADAFAILAPRETIRDRFDVTLGHFPGSDVPGKYEIVFPFTSPEYTSMKGLWTGEILSESLVVVKGK